MRQTISEKRIQYYEGNVMIRSRLALLLAEKGHRENRKVTYMVVVEETGLSKGVLVRLNDKSFGAGDERLSMDTLNTLCTYLSCGVGDILEFVPGEK